MPHCIKARRPSLTMEETLARIGERGIINKIRNVYGYAWEDDDAAAIGMGSSYMLVTTDSINRETHIPAGANPVTLGYFFAAINLSDIAAMGGKPEYFLSALTLPRSMRLKELLGMERGIAACLKKYGTRMIGGDTKEGAELCMTGIAIGAVARDRILRRRGAARGDLVCVTGTLGRNAAAYHMWKRTRSRLWANRILRVEPRVSEGMLIARHGATSAMDLSDGVLSALRQLSRLNRCGFELDEASLPIDRAARHASMELGIDTDRLALGFGGEYELLFTIPKARFASLASSARDSGVKISAIGRVVAGRVCSLIKDGNRFVMRDRGFEHFTRENP